MLTPEDKSTFRSLVLPLVCIAFLAIFLAAQFFPPDLGRQARRQPNCKSNLKQILLGLHNYHDTQGSFPPAYVADANGKPMHSWRVLILPYIEKGKLFDEYRFDEPWDGPNNSKLSKEIGAAYRCPIDIGEPTDTSYVVVVGENTMFPGARSLRMGDIKDGNSSTALVVEVANSGIHWMEPRDLSFDEAVKGINQMNGFGIASKHGHGAQIGLCDGSVRFVDESIPAERIRRLLERNDGQPVGEF